MKDLLDFNIADYKALVDLQDSFGNELVIREFIDASELQDKTYPPARMNAYSLILVLAGEMSVDLDYVSYRLKPNTLLEMHAGVILENPSFSSDFKGFQLISSHDLKVEVSRPLASYFPSNIVTLKRLYPVHELDAKEIDTLTDIIRRLQRYMADNDHFYRIPLIKNELATLVLESNNCFWKRHYTEDEKLTGSALITNRFRELLATHCRKEHEVTFYAEQLCVSADYLSRMMRDFSGTSALKWINRMLVTEAKILLRNPDMNIQQVSELLYFSDQSAFGKFFKKETGMSPLAYKKG